MAQVRRIPWQKWTTVEELFTFAVENKHFDTLDAARVKFAEFIKTFSGYKTSTKAQVHEAWWALYKDPVEDDDTDDDNPFKDEAEDVEFMSAALADEHSGVRRAAISALGTLGGTLVLEPIEFALSDEEPDVRLAAVRASRGMLRAPAASQPRPRWRLRRPDVRSAWSPARRAIDRAHASPRDLLLRGSLRQKASACDATEASTNRFS